MDSDYSELKTDFFMVYPSLAVRRYSAIAHRQVIYSTLQQYWKANLVLQSVLPKIFYFLK